MRIAVISVHGCPLLQPGTRESGGMNVYVKELSRHLGRKNLQIDIYTRWHDPDESQVVLLSKNVRVIHIEAGGFNVLAKERIYDHLTEFLYNLESFRKARSLEYDVIHSHYWLSGWAGTVLRRRWKVPHITMFHTLGEVKNNSRIGEHESQTRIRVERLIASKVDRIVAASPQEKDQMVRLYGSASARMQIIPCGVDLKEFRPRSKSAARRRLGLADKKTLLFVGRIDPIKGVDIMLESVSKLAENYDIQAVIVGAEPNVTNGKSSGYLEGLVHDMGIADKVTLAGSVDHKELPHYYNAADICVIPSYYESFGMVAIEAMASGTPVVASRVGGLQSTVRDWETGYLIPWHCADAFVERIELLLGNEALRLNFSKKGRASVAQYEWESVADEVLRLYYDVIQSSSQIASASIG
ncbi:MAG: glycosyltransferase family 1 protein [Dehalococcoidia bacterium]|nr:glycosyltransferase family 1 protein [Dehalococcoidia bacterium]